MGHGSRRPARWRRSPTPAGSQPGDPAALLRHNLLQTDREKRSPGQLHRKRQGLHNLLARGHRPVVGHHLLPRLRRHQCRRRHNPAALSRHNLLQTNRGAPRRLRQKRRNPRSPDNQLAPDRQVVSGPRRRLPRHRHQGNSQVEHRRRKRKPRSLRNPLGHGLRLANGRGNQRLRLRQTRSVIRLLCPRRERATRPLLRIHHPQPGSGDRRTR